MKLFALVLAADATEFVTVNRVAGVTGVACPQERFRDNYKVRCSEILLMKIMVLNHLIRRPAPTQGQQL